MRKAKVMLTAIAAFAILGGAFAFKANRATDFIYVGEDGTITVTGYKTTIRGVGTTTLATTTFGGVPTVTYYTTGL